jgi:putative hydrolase
VSDSGPFGGDNPFEGLPFFGDLGKLLGGLGGGGLQWDAARQVAVQVAASGEIDHNIDPAIRLDFEPLARAAELQVANFTGLSTSQAGRPISILPVTRTQWVQRSLEAYKPLFESLAGSLGQAAPTAEGDDTGDPMSAMLGQLMGAMAPMMLSMTAGGMIGHLAERSFGQYDIPVPRRASDELMVVVGNLDSFATDWSIDVDELRMWICLHEITHHAVLGVPHIRATLEKLIADYASGFRPDPNALMDRLGTIELGNPDAMAQLQGTLNDPEVLLGAVQTDEQRALRPQLESIVAVIVGYVDHVMDQVGGRLIGSYTMITEAARRRRVESSQSDRFVTDLFGLELGQNTYDAGAEFIDGVVERAGLGALDPLWADARFLPTPSEIAAPGLWLARIEIPTD